MNEYYVTIMSIDPNDHHGREQGDDHQKYGYLVQATSKRDAEEKGIVKFKQQYGDLPIYWVRVAED